MHTSNVASLALFVVSVALMGDVWRGVAGVVVVAVS
jgi:hypothetical protein